MGAEGWVGPILDPSTGAGWWDHIIQSEWKECLNGVVSFLSHPVLPVLFLHS